MVSTDFRAELAALNLPALVIQGDADASAPLECTGKPAAELMPRGRLVVYEGAPHGLFATHADRFQRDLQDFIRA